jgi:hypothetical protein
VSCVISHCVTTVSKSRTPYQFVAANILLQHRKHVIATCQIMVLYGMFQHLFGYKTLRYVNLFSDRPLYITQNINILSAILSSKCQFFIAYLKFSALYTAMNRLSEKLPYLCLPYGSLLVRRAQFTLLACTYRYWQFCHTTPLSITIRVYHDTRPARKRSTL